MRTPLLPLLAAALFFSAAPALAHDGGDGGSINCPIAHPASARHRVHHARRVGGCATQIAREDHRPMAGAGAGEGHGWAPPPRDAGDEYGRQNFSWAPTGPGDEHPGPSTWRPGSPDHGLDGAPPPPPAYAARDLDRRDQAEREFSDRAGHGAQILGQGDFDHRSLSERRFAFGYSHEEERSWSSQDGAVQHERDRRHCQDQASATDQYGFLTWPGKAHFWRSPPPSDQPMGPGGPPPWDGDPQGSLEVHP